MSPLKTSNRHFFGWLALVGLLLVLPSCQTQNNTSSAELVVSVPIEILFTTERDGGEILKAFDFINQETVMRVALAQNIVHCTMQSRPSEHRAHLDTLEAHQAIESVKVRE